MKIIARGGFRTWEGRFKSQALLDDAAIIACMAYVDLNPVRAKIAATPEKSSYTSIQRRINAAIQGKQPSNLLNFVGNEHKDKTKGFLFNFNDYIELIEVTGRCIRANKCDFIEENKTDTLTRLNISAENWLILTTQFTKSFHGAVGNPEALTAFCQHQHLKKRAAISVCQKLFA
jgi:hypothetical protein